MPILFALLQGKMGRSGDPGSLGPKVCVRSRCWNSLFWVYLLQLHRVSEKSSTLHL